MEGKGMEWNGIGYVGIVGRIGLSCTYGIEYRNEIERSLAIYRIIMSVSGPSTLWIEI